MADFKVGDTAIYIGPVAGYHHPIMAFYANQVCTIIDPLGVYEMATKPRYGVKFSDGKKCWVLPANLRKPPPKHQPADLKAAEPLFIHGQLQRWLNPEKEKTLEKSS